jgi:hypothetical protein
MKKLSLLLSIIILLSPLVTVASNCSTNLGILDLEKIQGVISVVDSTESDISSAKKIMNTETILVEELSAEIFNQIANNPESIAFILGAELIEKKSLREFKLKIPGVLGFDLSFWVKTELLANNKVKIELTGFNTFFLKGRAEVELIEVGDQSAIKVNGSAFVPSAAAKIFIFGVGGEKNFKNLIQSEIDKQVELGLEQFESLR